MKYLKRLAQRYIDWLIRLGRVKFSLLGVFLLAIFALVLQMLLSSLIAVDIYWIGIARSIIFGIISAPFIIYFFAVLIERLEASRSQLSRSVTELKKEVSERKQTEQKLSIALENLEKIHRDKSNLMETISHELRTPLNGIIGLSRILLDGDLTAEQRSYLKTINVSAINLGNIFSDIIDLNKLDTNRLELNLKPTNLHALLTDIQNFAVLMTAPKQLKFSLDITSDLPELLYLDSARLSQILWNLIVNAVKFTEKGEVKLSVSAQGEGHYHFRVSDTGRGIPQSEWDNIFKMYYQLKENSNRFSGSGIGLAISKNLALLMNGDLEVESQIGKGSTFHLTIKAEEANSVENQHFSQPLNLSVLLVEDIELNVIVAKSVLERLGHHVDVAMTGKEAIQLFERNFYDIVLLDIKLPDMSGFEIAAYLRQKYEEGIYDFLPPIVAFTASIMQNEKEYLEKGMDAVLRKPLALNELKQCFYHFFSDENRVNEEEPSLSCSLNTELIDLLGKSQTKENLALFKQVMPSYLKQLNDAFNDYLNEPSLQKEVVDIAHKIKGAAGSVGLVQLQQLAEKIQNNQSTEWKEKIENWVNELNHCWKANVEKLEDYLNL
ncbi:ATP-binding protein [Rodentibacter heidelbergensis]|uniref:Aerobic respiration control sensor protein n=1 Tax=Rodentibacter heidelbergensis TaxID=1908258 RepID=A0A1V3I791_9PAST|nr:ATP-binding protein [Rodentibacter heidelbergensis]OOF35603.1 hybrid sensor histidine kinase/response regulator [Rodentibacter heidelbergensis]